MFLPFNKLIKVSIYLGHNGGLGVELALAAASLHCECGLMPLSYSVTAHKHGGVGVDIILMVGE